MPRGDKDKYADKQKRRAERIEKGCEARRLSGEKAEKCLSATVNKQGGSGKLSGSGRKKSGSNDN